MGLNVVTLFVGFGLGSLIFGALLHFGFGAALGAFSAVESAAAVCTLWWFRSETPIAARSGE